MDYSNYSPYSQTGDEIMAIMAIIIVISFVIAFAIVGVFFILQAVGMMGIAKNRGMKNPWLGFIPIASSYLLGGIADNINESYGKKTSFRIVLPILSTISTISTFFSLSFYFSLIFEIFETALYNYEIGPYTMFGKMGPLIMFYLIMFLVSIAGIVLNIMAFYRIGKEYSPQNSVIYIILPIFFGLYATGIMLFSIRNKAPWYLQPQYAQQAGAYGQPGQPQPPQGPPPPMA